MKIAFRECWQGFFLCIAVGACSVGGFYALPQWSMLWTILLWVSGLGVLVLLFFFRDPDRSSLLNERLILAPADGTVMSIEDGVQHEFITGPAKRVSIFLAVYNVHVQRSPIDGLVERLEHRRGRFHPAWNNLASKQNEQNMIGIRRSDFSVLLCQVAGVLARRTVSWVGARCFASGLGVRRNGHAQDSRSGRRSTDA